MLIFLASVCVEPKGTHLPDRKAIGKIKSVSVRLLAAVNKKMLFLHARLYFATIKLPIVSTKHVGSTVAQLSCRELS